MSAETEFLIVCIEEYKTAHHLTVRDVIDLFNTYDVSGYIRRHRRLYCPFYGRRFCFSAAASFLNMTAYRMLNTYQGISESSEHTSPTIPAVDGTIMNIADSSPQVAEALLYSVLLYIHMEIISSVMPFRT
jgi:hypothetical protein